MRPMENSGAGTRDPSGSRPPGWIRLGILVGACGYTLTAAVSLATRSGTPLQDGASAVLLWGALAFSRRWPVTASRLTIAAVWLELTLSVGEGPQLTSVSLMVYPLLTLVAGLLLGGRAALAVAWASAVAIPLAYSLNGRWLRGGLPGADAITLTVAAVILVGTALLTRAALAAHRQGLDASERARRRYRDLFENAPDGMVALGADGRITEINQLAARFLGGERAALLGAPLAEVLARAGAPAPVALAAAREGAPAVLELARGGAPVRTLEVQSRRDPDPDEGPGTSLLVLRDVTERRSLEERLGHALRLESVGQLAGGVAHDFNNLLTAVGGNAALLAGHADPEVRELAADIQAAQQRGVALTRQLLAFARRDVRKPEVIDLGEAAQQMRRLLERLLGEQHRLALAREGPAPVLADRAQLEQTLLNLVTNARDAMPGGGAVEVAIRRLEHAEAAGLGSGLAAGCQVLLEVADSGVGMSAETQARAFEPFFTTKPRGQGTGLGLATVHGIVAQSGGQVVLDSAPGRGSRFRVFLPCAGSDPVRTGVPAAAPAPGGRERILVAEDDEQVRGLASRVLVRAGYDVVVATNAEAALAAADGLPELHLLLTDVAMPGLTGPELAARLRRSRPGLPVVFMSGYFEAAETPRDGLDPARNLLQKPFEPDALLRMVRAILDAPAAGGAA